MFKFKEQLSYDANTGIFIWINPAIHKLGLAGVEAGTISHSRGKKYRVITVNKKRHKAHRLAWFFVYGKMPLGSIDHKNGDSLDNRISNLRDVNHFQNTQNHKSRIKNNGLPTGVCLAVNKYRARITENKKVHHLGSFETKEEAESAYLSARKALHDAPIMRV